MDDNSDHAFLEMLQGGVVTRTFPLTTPRTILGRHPSCGIVLDDASVSRQHATIIETSDGYMIEDHASRNRTFVDDQPIPLNISVPLRDSALIRICSVTFRFRDQKNAVRIDDGESTRSVVTSRLSVSGDPSSVRIHVNAEQKLRALIEISRSLGRAIKMDDIFPELLDSLFRIFPQADRGFVGCTDPLTNKLVPKTWKSRTPGSGQLRISRTIVNAAIESKEAILSTDAANDDRFDMAASIVDMKLRSMMCTPLVTADGRVLGVIQIDTTSSKSQFTNDDLEVLGSVASQACSAIENAQLHETALQQEVMRRELELGRQVQQGFLPSEPPLFPGYRFFHFYEAAKKVGGDYFDYIPLHDGRLAVVIADVSGKGVAAALFTAKLSAEMRYCLASTDDLHEAVRRLNNAFCSERKELEGRFITCVVVVLDPKSNRIEFANAGHMNLIVRRPDRTTVEIGDEIVEQPLGIFADNDYQTATASIQPGEYVFLYTDGLSDAENAEKLRYGGERIHRVLGRTPFHELESSLLGDVRTYVGIQPHTDDMCLVAFERMEN